MEIKIGDLWYYQSEIADLNCVETYDCFNNFYQLFYNFFEDKEYQEEVTFDNVHMYRHDLRELFIKESLLHAHNEFFKKILKQENKYARIDYYFNDIQFKHNLVDDSNYINFNIMAINKKTKKLYNITNENIDNSDYDYIFIYSKYHGDVNKETYYVTYDKYDYSLMEAMRVYFEGDEERITSTFFPLQAFIYDYLVTPHYGSLRYVFNHRLLLVDCYKDDGSHDLYLPWTISKPISFIQGIFYNYKKYKDILITPPKFLIDNSVIYVDSNIKFKIGDIELVYNGENLDNFLLEFKYYYDSVSSELKKNKDSDDNIVPPFYEFNPQKICQVVNDREVILYNI